MALQSTNIYIMNVDVDSYVKLSFNGVKSPYPLKLAIGYEQLYCLQNNQTHVMIHICQYVSLLSYLYISYENRTIFLVICGVLAFE